MNRFSNHLCLVISLCLATVGIAGTKNATGSAEPKPKSQTKKPLNALNLLRKYRSKAPEVAYPLNKERIIHFPKERSLGRLTIQDANAVRDIQTFYYWTRAGDSDWEYLGEAQGSVTVPAGKRLSLSIDQNEWKDLSPLANLGADDLYKLSISGQYNGGQFPDDRCMPHIAHLTGLKALYFGNTNISSEGMKFITNFKSLEYLRLPTNIADSGLAHAGRLRSLKGLYFKKNSITDAGLRHLEKLSVLEELALEGGHITDAGLAHLVNLPSLHYLLLNNKNFTDAGMVHLKNIPSLRILNLGYLPITDAGLVHLSNCRRLENLTLYRTQVTNAGLVHLKRNRSLKKLDISYTQVTDQGLVHLNQIESLEYLRLPNQGLTDKGLAHLSPLYRLKHLSVGLSTASPITNAGLEHIANLKSLEHLSIGGQGITDAGMVHLAKLSNLKHLSLWTGPLNKGQLTGDGLAKLTELKSLETLDLHQTNMTLSTLNQLNTLANLTKLRVRQIRRGKSILDIAGLTKLEELTLSLKVKRVGTLIVREQIRDEDLACLANLKFLKRLSGIGGISDAGLRYLAGLNNMERLHIGGPHLTDEGLSYLANMKKLDSLTISDGDFTDKGLRHLEGLKLLRYLNITSANAFSNAALQHLRKNLPNLYTFRVMP